MGIQLRSLDGAVRERMVSELNSDVVDDIYWKSPRLTDAGLEAWPSLLRSAMLEHDDVWLAGQLRSGQMLRDREDRHLKSGIVSAKVPVTAADTLAEGEFNKYYMRAVCDDVCCAGGGEVVIYRGKEVRDPRPRSAELIGSVVDAGELLSALRSGLPLDEHLGLPGGPNSGLTVCRLGDL